MGAHWLPFQVCPLGQLGLGWQFPLSSSTEPEGQTHTPLMLTIPDEQGKMQLLPFHCWPWGHSQILRLGFQTCPWLQVTQLKPFQLAPLVHVMHWFPFQFWPG